MTEVWELIGAPINLFKVLLLLQRRFGRVAAATNDCCRLFIEGFLLPYLTI